MLRSHGDALDFDLFDRWRVRLRDVPTTIGWDAVALFLRHLPYDSELTRELSPRAKWSPEVHMMANVADLVGGLFAKDYEPVTRPGDVAIVYNEHAPRTKKSRNLSTAASYISK